MNCVCTVHDKYGKFCVRVCGVLFVMSLLFNHRSKETS